MELLWFPILFLLAGTPQSSASERCDDWGLDPMRQIQVYEGEPAHIQCPLFEHFLKFNYSTAHSAGLTLIWYWTGQDQDLEEPINFRLPDNRISKEKDLIWFRPTLLNDTGNYTCMLRNTTYCSKVAFPLEVIQKSSCFSSRMKVPREYLYVEHTLQTLKCPNIEGFFPSSVQPKVIWYMSKPRPRTQSYTESKSQDANPALRTPNPTSLQPSSSRDGETDTPICDIVKNFFKVDVNGTELIFTYVLTSNSANYTCVVTYPENGRIFNLTRTVEVKVADDHYPAPVSLLGTYPISRQLLLNILNRIETVSVIGDRTITRILSIKKVTSEDLKRNYTCHARNEKGESVKQAIVKQIVVPPRYTVELACGFAVTIVLIIILIVVYHVYWLEMVLFYRAHFGTDETILDGKEYDIYVSYARNAEEEEFVLLTLRGVLENEFGYKLCIFDRDSLPGGNTVEAVFDFIQRSRRMIVVLSPDYLTEKSISLLEFKLGVLCQNSIATQLVVVEYRPLEQPHPSILQLKDSVSFVSWEGERSKRSGSKFWKALRLALPLRSLSAGSGWNESCSSQSDISLDHIQRRRGRLKVPQEFLGSRRATGAGPPTPGAAAKHQGKPSVACRCCVTYCKGEKPLRNKNRADAPIQPQWETHLCKPVPQQVGTHWVQNGNRSSTPAPQISALALHHFTDLSNNNDFYVL
ncbi:interleukin-1 receptor accessory protein [Gracilinanus agilis]|uniref:interleukin-1 receptor accessory protein n=1 Tax=Gracilinanus agilis TaxID=191870 RepID=UPI001CFCC600|nr:interleukin-1 receptor accessory protein [Gracilinanus agilis]